jgi:hypothetical protein
MVIKNKWFQASLVAILTLILSYTLRPYLVSTYQKGSLILISGLLFCLFLVYQEFILERPAPQLLLPGGRKISLPTVLLSLLLIVLILFITKSFYSLKTTGYLNIYEIISLSACYQKFGLVKRGLMPTLVNMVSTSDYKVQIFSATAIGLLVFAMGLIALYRSKRFAQDQKLYMIGIFLLAPIGFYSQFKFIAGAYDMALIGFFFLAMAGNGKPWSLIFDICGILLHEAYFFLRLPFLLFNIYADLIGLGGRKKIFLSWNLAQLLLSGMVFLLMSSNLVRPPLADLRQHFFQLYPGLPTPSEGNFHALDPMTKEVDLSFQMKIMNEYHHSPEFRTYFIPVVFSLIVIILLGYLFNGLKAREKRIDLAFTLMAFAIPLVLSIVATDVGRWMNFGFIAVLSYYILIRPTLFSDGKISWLYLFWLLILIFLLTPLGIFEQPLFSILLGHYYPTPQAF